jgi:hypothetical protein
MLVEGFEILREARIWRNRQDTGIDQRGRDKRGGRYEGILMEESIRAMRHGIMAL